MNKKILFGMAVLFLCLVSGGVFYWRQNQADVRELNKTLPEGIMVAKSLFGDEYKVVNKIDGYEFKVPKEWQGIEEIEYIPKSIEEEYDVASINAKSISNENKLVAIDRFKMNEKISLDNSVEEIFGYYELSGDFVRDSIIGVNIIKVQENTHLGGMYVYFFEKESIIYSITNGSEDFIRYIIANGKW